jgi:hypothetical protein
MVSKINSLEKKADIKGRPIKLKRDTRIKLLVRGIVFLALPIVRKSWYLLLLWITLPVAKKSKALKNA